MASISKEYAVNWKDHMSHMKGAFESLFDSNEFVDVTLYCDGQRIGAHKMVLAACSPYFRNIFKDVPCQHHVIVLNNVDFSVVEQLVQFIYHGEVSVPNSKLNSFLQTGRRLQISGLTGVKSLNGTSKVEEVVGPSGIDVNKRKPKKSELEKFPRLYAVPTEVEDIKLVSVECEQDEPESFDYVLEDPLEQDSSLHDYVIEAAYLSEEGELESENVDDMGANEEVPDEIDATASTTKDSAASVLPSKSKRSYEDAYSAYSKWCREQNIETTTEDSILTYFESQLSGRKSSTLWTKYSILRSTISLNEGIDISKFSGIVPFLKTKGERHPPKKPPADNEKRPLEKHFLCPKCGYRFKSNYRMRYHLKDCGQKVDCEECGKTMKNKAAFLRHDKFVHKKQKYFQCPLCDKRFTCRYDLETHRQGVHEKTRLKCTKCSATASNRSNLMRHIKKFNH